MWDAFGPHPIYPGAIIGVVLGANSDFILRVSHLHSRVLCALVCGAIVGALTWYVRLGDRH